ncbi:hypothetical protein HPULCUR_006358 [Helicostylum pulchrum]|uniref:Uncharacterized protein n=1 Tax=Helicostylum pulchrum TaxID=562976 RepID=A0ABP9Y1Q4_9FUNG
MTQSSTDDSDRKEAAKFYSKWMNGGNKDENWDEVCLQWCKQQSAARKDQKDPNCSMLCFRSPTTTTAQDTNQLSDEKSWNPLKGYSVLVVNGKEGCVSHIDEMKHAKESESMNEKSATAPTKYTIDLGNIWSEAGVGVKYVFDKKVVPMYNSTVEQASEWTKGPEAAQMKEYVKEKTDVLYKQVFRTAPPSTIKPEDEKK